MIWRQSFSAQQSFLLLYSNYHLKQFCEYLLFSSIETHFFFHLLMFWSLLLRCYISIILCHFFVLLIYLVFSLLILWELRRFVIHIFCCCCALSILDLTFSNAHYNPVSELLVSLYFLCISLFYFITSCI